MFFCTQTIATTTTLTTTTTATTTTKQQRKGGASLFARTCCLRDVDKRQKYLVYKQQKFYSLHTAFKKLFLYIRHIILRLANGLSALLNPDISCFHQQLKK